MRRKTSRAFLNGKMRKRPIIERALRENSEKVEPAQRRQTEQDAQRVRGRLRAERGHVRPLNSCKSIGVVYKGRSSRGVNLE